MTMSKVDITRRLLETKKILKEEIRKEFEDFVIDIPNNRLYSHNHKYVLEWTPKLFPDEPASHANYSPTQGVVRCYAVVDDLIMRD